MTYLADLIEICDQQLDAATFATDRNFKRDNYFTRRARLRHFKKQLRSLYGRGYQTMMRLESLRWQAWMRLHA